MNSGDQITMWANASGVRNNDLHCLFGHLHLDQNEEFQEHEIRITQLEQDNKMYRNQIATLESQLAAVAA